MEKDEILNHISEVLTASKKFSNCSRSIHDYMRIYVNYGPLGHPEGSGIYVYLHDGYIVCGYYDINEQIPLSDPKCFEAIPNACENVISRYRARKLLQFEKLKVIETSFVNKPAMPFDQSEE